MALVSIWPRRTVIAALLLAVVACATPLDRAEDVVGVYDLKWDGTVDQLEVRPDGRYVRTYHTEGGAAVVDSGAWTMSHASGETRVEFANWLPSWRAQTFPDIPMRRGYWVPYAERGLTGQVRISVESDIGLAYVRRQ